MSQDKILSGMIKTQKISPPSLKIQILQFITIEELPLARDNQEKPTLSKKKTH